LAIDTARTSILPSSGDSTPMCATRFLILLSVPKILTLFIPEILSRPAIAGRAKTLSVPAVGEPAGPREEDVRNVKASRSRNSTEGRSLQGRSGPFGGSVSV